MYLTTLLVIYMLVSVSYSYPNGAPGGRCDSMIPNHGASAQSGASSYAITPSKNTYECGESINVTLSGGNFKGFLCQPRKNVNSYSTVGSLTDTDDSVAATNNCGEQAALTHTENGIKTSFQFSWTHSGTSTDDIYIVCTVVEAKLTYWVKLTSSAITHSGKTCSGASHLISPVLLLFACTILNLMK